MKKVLAFTGAVAVLTGAVVISATLEKEASLLAATPIEDLRLARTSAEPSDADCDGGWIQYLNWWICITSEASVPNEVTAISPVNQIRFVVCNVDGACVTRFELASLALEAGCVIPTGSGDLLFPGVSFHNLETDLDGALATACNPCPIQGGAWGPCPCCLLPITPSCAVACPEE